MYQTRVALQFLQRKPLRLRTQQLQSRNKNTKGTKPRNIKRHASTTSTSNQQATAAAAKAESFLNGGNSVYVEEMYESWLKDPGSVHKV